MREEYVFKDFFFLIGPEGGKYYKISHTICLLSLTFFSSARKTKKIVLKIRSQILGKTAVLVHEISLKEKCKQVKTHKSSKT